MMRRFKKKMQKYSILGIRTLLKQLFFEKTINSSIFVNAERNKNKKT